MSSEWREHSLLDIYDVTNGLNKGRKEFGFGYPFLTFKEVFYNYFVPEELTSLANTNTKERHKCSVRTGDVFITRTSETFDELGMSCVAIKDYPDASFNGFCKRLRPNGLVEIDAEYSAFFFNSPGFRKQILSLANMSTRASLNNDMLKSLTVKLPPLDVQQSIAKVLVDLHDKIQLNHQINQTLEQMAQAIFKSWFVDFEPVKAKIAALEAGGSEEDALLAAMQAISGTSLFDAGALAAGAAEQLARLQAERPEQYAELRATAEMFPSAMQESELGEIPEGWRSGLLSDICDFQNGHAFKSKDWSDSGFAVVKIGSVKPAFVDIHSCSYVKDRTIAGLERFELFAGDLLVGMTGYPGETGLVPITENRLFLNQRVGRLKPKQKTQKALLYCNARDPDFKQYVETQAHGSAQANISGRAIGQYPITIPTDSVVEQFSTLIDPLLQQKLNLNAVSTALATIKDTLLPQLLSGEISVTKTKYQSQLAVEPSDIGDGVAGNE